MKRISRAKIRLSHQINNYFCGPAVIVTVLAAYNIHITQRKVARLARTNKTIGTSTKGLVRALRSFGVRVKAGKSTLENIRRDFRSGVTVIVCYTEPYYDSGHFAIVAGFRGRNILLLSPDERGNRATAMALKEFQERWKDPLFTRSRRWAAYVQVRK